MFAKSVVYAMGALININEFWGRYKSALNLPLMRCNLLEVRYCALTVADQKTRHEFTMYAPSAFRTLFDRSIRQRIVRE